MDRDQNNHVDNIHDDKVDHKMGRDFRNLGSHAAMVHLHSGIEHLNNVDVEVEFSSIYFVILLFEFFIFFYIVSYFIIFIILGKISERRPWFFRFGTIVRIMRGLWR